MERKIDLRRTADELTAYAAERQAGFEQHQMGSTFRQPETRNEWIRNILLGMAEVNGADGAELTARFDRHLDEACGCFGTETLPQSGQEHLVQSLRQYAAALEQQGGDQRERLMQVRDLLEDMTACLSWRPEVVGFYPARDQVTEQLLRMTAQRPICFTHVMLGGDFDVGGVEFLSGSVNTHAKVQLTQVFQQLMAEFPRCNTWPARCTVYRGGGRQPELPSIDADKLDMKIIRATGNQFLKQAGVIPVFTDHLQVPVYENIHVLKVEPGRPPKEMTIPHTLEVFQNTVGGSIEILDLDSDACLVCNEEGKLIGLPANRRIGGDIIAGTFLIVGAADGDLCSLSDDAAAYYTKHFAEPISEPGQEELRGFTYGSIM